MSTKQQLRRTVSLSLALALMLWAQAVPAMNPSSAHVHACRGMSHAAMHGTQLSSHPCCPQQLHATFSLPEPSVTTVASLCHQDCCTVQRQPARGFTFLASNNRPAADSVRESVESTATPSATTFEVRVVHFSPFTKAVFDLKADLRV
jgi:hypothetical protein